MIDEIRSYIKQTVYAVDPKLRWDGFVFGTEVNSNNNIDNEYKISIGDVTPSLIDTNYRAIVPCVVTIYRGFNTNDIENEYNQMFCKGIDIVSKAMDKTRQPQTDFIKNVLGTTMSPIPVEGNDNMIQINIQLDVEVFFAST